MFDFPFTLGDTLTIISSGETGVARGLSIFANGCKQVNLHYQAADGRAVDNWFDVDLLVLDPELQDNLED